MQSLRSAASIGAAGCAVAWQVDTHAAARIEAEDRASLERLWRYVTGPPLAACRLQFIDVDHLTFRLKTPWSDGTTHLVLSPLELIEKLAALSYDHANEERYGAAIEALDAAGKTGSTEALAAANVEADLASSNLPGGRPPSPLAVCGALVSLAEGWAGWAGCRLKEDCEG